jgi:hypothetical protein
MVNEYELANALRFDWIVRLRPDAWFFAPDSPVHCDLDPSAGIVSPAGVAGCIAPCINDHIAWIPRAWADAYFDAASDIEGCHGKTFMTNAGTRSLGGYLRHRLEIRHVPLTSRFVSYTIVRPCATFDAKHGDAYPDCVRVRSPIPSGVDLLEQAHNQSAQEARQWLRSSNYSAVRGAMYAACMEGWKWPQTSLTDPSSSPVSSGEATPATSPTDAAVLHFAPNVSNCPR